MENIGTKIVIVDDDPAIRMLYSDELFEEGYNVITCGDGLGLMKAIRKEIPDLIVMDIRLGCDNGLDPLQDLKTTRPNRPVILCTAYQAFDHDMKPVAADYYVTKSSDLQELKATIKNALNGERSPQSATRESLLHDPEPLPMEQRRIPLKGAEGPWSNKTDSG